jgi:pimeloyl-ACP methyl ester carboxylesterase
MGDRTDASRAVSRGSAVLVTGSWSPPEDWDLVSDRLRVRGIDVVAVDLPSNRLPDATRADDVAETQRAIAQAREPVVVVGWSYGGTVVSDAAAGQSTVVRLIYVAAVPLPSFPSTGDEPPTQEPDVSHVLFPDEQTCVLDDQWWLTEGDGATLPAPVISHLWAHRRRPMSLTALLGSQQEEAWRTIPTSVLLGREDELVPAPLLEWARSHFHDVRIIDCDHFMLFRCPDTVADLVVEAVEHRAPAAKSQQAP